MKTKPFFFSVLPALILIMMCTSTFAQRNNNLSGNPMEEFIEIWRERSDTISLGKDTLGLEYIDNIKKKMSLYGIRNAPEIAITLINEVEERKSDLSKDERIQLLKIAREMVPDVPSLNIKLAGYFLSLSNLSFKDGLSSLTLGVKSYFHDVESTFRLITNILYWSWIALCITFLIFFLIMTLKYFHALIHMMDHFTPKIFSKLTTILLLIFIPLVFLLCLGPLSLIFILAIYYWLLSNLNEKVAISSFIAVIIFIPHIFYFSAYPIRYQESVEKRILSLELSPDQRNNLETIEEITKADPDDVEAAFTMALIQKRIGNYKQAKITLEKVLSKNPNMTKALINLGNINYILGNLTNAISSYSKASSINNKSFLANYNLGKALYNETRIEEANQALKRAASIDSVRFKKYENISNPKNPLQYVFDEKIRANDLKQRISKFRKPSLEFRNKIWTKKSPLNMSPNGTSLAGLIVFIILILLSKFSRAIEPPRVCEICGAAFCKKCSRLSEHRDICSPCHFIFIRKESLEPAFKAKKENEEKRHRTVSVILKNWISFLIPGMGHIYFGKAVSGAIIVFLFALLATWIYLPNGLIENPLTATLAGTHVSIILISVVALAVYVFVNITIRKAK